MSTHASPHIISGEQMTSARILADAINSSPAGFCVSDFSLFTTMFWYEEHGTQGARDHFYEKLKEELGELDYELGVSPIETLKAIEEYGDVTFCVFALGNSFGLDMTLFVKDLWARQSTRDIQCRADPSGPPYIESAINSGVVRNYRATRYGLTLLNQPYIYNFRPGEGHAEQREYQLDIVGNALREPLSRPVQLLVGYSETKRISEALDEDRAMTLGMANNMSKIIGRVEGARK